MDARTSAATPSAVERLAQLIEPGSLLEATPECLVVTAADGKILFANHRMEDLTGFAPDALLGQSVAMLLPAGLGGADQGARFEAACHHSGGTDFPVEVHLGAIEGPERLLVVTFRDASELQEGREARYEAEVKYRTLVEQIPAVVYLDPVNENEDDSTQLTTSEEFDLFVPSGRVHAQRFGDPRAPLVLCVG
ncbi:MAG: PAS domain-containing protein, partial [Actinomycetota bacterium]